MAIISGTSGNDRIKGTSSADTISGKAGGDRIYGLSGNDIIFGNDGSDLLIGGGGRDTLTGGAGADFFQYLRFADSRGANVDLIKDFDPGSGGSGDVVLLTELGTATHQAAYDPNFTGLQAVFVYNATTNVTTLSYYEGSSTPVFQLKFTGNVHYDRFAFEGIIPGSSPTEGDDDVVGTANADTINLLGGGDHYHGLGGNDSVAGGSGDDQIFGEDGNDNLRGGSGVDIINGGEGNDIVYGGADGDSLGGGPGNDTVYGGDGDDHLVGVQNDGDDFYWGQLGDDFLFAGGGNDSLNGGGGFDTVGVHFFGGSFSGYTITKNANGTITLTDINPSDGDFDTGTDTLISVEAIQFDDGLYIVATGTFTPSDSVI